MTNGIKYYDQKITNGKSHKSNFTTNVAICEVI